MIHQIARLITIGTITIGTIATCSAGTVAASIIFDFQKETPTAFRSNHPGAYSSLSISRSSLTMEILRPGGRFDISRFFGGNQTLDPFSQATSSTPFVLNFSQPVRRVSVNMGDFGQDSPDILSLKAFTSRNRIGSLQKTDSGILVTTDPVNNPFKSDTLSVDSSPTRAIRSVEMIGGSTDFANSVYYDDINVTPFNIKDIVDGAIHVKLSGNTIKAYFRPNFLITLDEAAAIGGYDHFNWVQLVTKYPGGVLPGGKIVGSVCFPTSIPVFSPFTDPLPGGQNCQPADSLPFYWDEGDNSALDPDYNVDYWTSTPQLTFTDTPSNMFVIPGVNKMSFVTTLAGIRNDNSWDPLYNFSWSSNYNPLGFGPLGFGPLGFGGVSQNRNIHPFPPGGVGGVFGLDILDIQDVSVGVRKLWIENGATLAQIPEPPTILIFVIGIIWMVGFDTLSRANPINGASSTFRVESIEFLKI